MKNPTLLYKRLLAEIQEHNSKIRAKEQQGIYIPARKLPKIPTGKGKYLSSAAKAKITRAYKSAFPLPPHTSEIKIPKIRGEKDVDYWNRVFEIKKKFHQNEGFGVIRFDTNGAKAKINEEGFLQWNDKTFVYWYIPVDSVDLVKSAHKVVKDLIKKYNPYAIATAHEFYMGRNSKAHPAKKGKVGSFAPGTQKGILSYLTKFMNKYNLSDNPNALTGFVLSFELTEFMEGVLKNAKEKSSPRKRKAKKK